MISQRREKGLCFEYGLPGHQAASHRKNRVKKPWKGKRKQASVIEGLRQQLYVINKGKNRERSDLAKVTFEADKLDSELTDSNEE